MRHVDRSPPRSTYPAAPTSTLCLRPEGATLFTPLRITSCAAVGHALGISGGACPNNGAEPASAMSRDLHHLGARASPSHSSPASRSACSGTRSPGYAAQSSESFGLRLHILGVIAGAGEQLDAAGQLLNGEVIRHGKWIRTIGARHKLARKMNHVVPRRQGL